MTTISNTPARVNIILSEGADFSRVFTYTDADDVAIDLTSGYTAEMKVKAYKGAAVALDTLTDANSRIVLNNGSFEIKFTPAQVALLGYEKTFYDLMFTVGGVTDKAMEGSITIDRSVTV